MVKFPKRKLQIKGLTVIPLKGHPVQVKQSDHVGRNVVDNFETAMRRRKAKKGVIVAFSFGKGAYEGIARVKIHGGLEIEAVTIDDIIKNRSKNAQKKLS